ncbi:hypothetical protein KKG15_01685 [Patescibacteria group bacterium]|nr:hypothetical protein [Patescibacteria group bacterium]
MAKAEERQYINIGGNPIEKDICKKRNLETYRLTEDKYAVVTDKDNNIIVNWLKKGEEIGKYGKREVVCSCGNTVKFLSEEKIKIVEKIVEVPVEKIIEVEKKSKTDDDVIIIVVEDDYEEPVPVYYPYRSYPYYSGYSYPAISYSYEYRRPSYRHYNYHRHRHNYPAHHRHYRHHRR